MPAIEIANLSKTYRVGFWRSKPKIALRDLSLSVAEGEVFGFLGPNGSGKTTTLKLLNGLAFPTTGYARVLGYDCRDPRVRAQIGFLPEQPYFYDYLTPTELLHYYGRLSGVPSSQIAPRLKEMLLRVGLGDSAGIQLRKFSKGMLQRVGIAQAIFHDPKVVFLDEPMSGLDPVGRREVRDLIQGLKDEGKTVFFSTHILSDAEALCDRVAVVYKGDLRGIGVVADMTTAARGSVEVVYHGSDAALLSAFGAVGRSSGQTVRAEIQESQLEAALAHLRTRNARLISVTPVRGTVEEYFLSKLGNVTPLPKEVQP